MLGRVYGCDPLGCPRCGSTMKVISIIHDPEVIHKILSHLGLDKRPRGPPPPQRAVIYDELPPEFEEGVDGPFRDEPC